MSTELPNLDEPISYAVDNGAQSGPFTMRDIVESVRSGERAPDTYVWWAGEEEWVPFNSVDALMTLANPSPQSITPEPEEPVADPPPPTAADAAVDPTEVELGDSGQPGDVFEIDEAAADADEAVATEVVEREEAQPEAEAEDPESLGAQMFGGHGATTEIIEASNQPAEAAPDTQSFAEPFEAVENPFAEIDNGELDDVDWSRDDETAPEAEPETDAEAHAEPEEEAQAEPHADAESDADDGVDRSPLELVNDRIEALGATGAVALADDADAGDGGHEADQEAGDEAGSEPEPVAEIELQDSWSELQARSDELASSIVFANHRVAAVADAVVASLSEHGYEVAAETAVGLTHRLHASPADDGGDDVSATVAGLVSRSGSAGEHVEVSMHRQDASVSLIWEMAEYDGNQTAVATAVHSMLAELGRRVGG